MNSIRAAFYARVSSEQQATAHTIDSQITALSERAQTDGFPIRLSTRDTAVPRSFAPAMDKTARFGYCRRNRPHLRALT